MYSATDVYGASPAPGIPGPGRSKISLSAVIDSPHATAVSSRTSQIIRAGVVSDPTVALVGLVAAAVILAKWAR